MDDKIRQWLTRGRTIDITTRGPPFGGTAPDRDRLSQHRRDLGRYSG
jgi:hypothetical protein